MNATRVYPMVTVSAVIYDADHIPMYSEQTELPDSSALFVEAFVLRWPVMWPVVWL